MGTFMGIFHAFCVEFACKNNGVATIRVKSMVNAFYYSYAFFLSFLPRTSKHTRRMGSLYCSLRVGVAVLINNASVVNL